VRAPGRGSDYRLRRVREGWRWGRPDPPRECPRARYQQWPEGALLDVVHLGVRTRVVALLLKLPRCVRLQPPLGSVAAGCTAVKPMSENILIVLQLLEDAVECDNRFPAGLSVHGAVGRTYPFLRLPVAIEGPRVARAR